MPLFDDLTLQNARDIVATRYSKQAAIVTAFYNGDHWQQATGWVGPQYNEDHELYQDTIKLIEDNFISQNVIGELTDRHVSGVLGRELHWKLVPRVMPEPITEPDPDTGKPVQKPGEISPEVEALIKEAEGLVLEWWNKRNVLEVLKQALAGALNTKRGPLRFSIPPGLRDAQGNLPPISDPEKAGDLVYLQAMCFDEDLVEQIVPACTVYTDKNTRKQIGIFSYKAPPSVEEVGTGTGDPRQYAEISYVDERGFTIVKVLGEKGQVGVAAEMQINGNILMYEMARKALISPQIVSQQKAYNMATTMQTRNDVQGGFLERIFFNVKWPNKDVVQDGTITKVPTTLYTGAGSTSSLQGETFIDAAGVTHVLPPSVTFRDPVASSTFIESKDSTYRGMLKEANQLHYDTASDGTLSGESRKQARDAYTKDLKTSGNLVEGATRWVIETHLALVAFLSGKAGRYDSLRAYVEAKIDAGPLSAEEKKTARDDWAAGFIDHETALSESGRDDVDAIKQRLQQETAEKRDRELAQAEQEVTRQERLNASQAQAKAQAQGGNNGDQ